MKFQPGQSGNPAGKPKGLGARQKLYEELLLPRGRELLEAAFKLALKPDKTMLCFLLERVLPKVKDDDELSMNTLLEKFIDKLPDK